LRLIGARQTRFFARIAATDSEDATVRFSFAGCFADDSERLLHARTHMKRDDNDATAAI
jgi:hypothetical protein